MRTGGTPEKAGTAGSLDICFVSASYWPLWGGAERQCQLLGAELQRRGHRVTVLTRAQPGTPGREIVDRLAIRRTVAFGSGVIRSLSWTLSAASWLRRHGRDFHIIQCYQLLSPTHVGVLGHHSSRSQRVVALAECSGAYGDIAEIRRLPATGLRRQLLLRVDAFVTLTRDIQAELAGFGLERVPSYLIPNAVDASVFTPVDPEEKQALRRRLGLPEDLTLCVFAGRLTAQKNPELLIEAWCRLDLPRARLTFVGDGPLRASLESLARARCRDGHVLFAGATTDVVSYLRSADVLVLPSRAEGIPTVLLEAMACGLPVVATNVAGNREVVGVDGTAGRLVPADEPAALAEAVATLVASASLRRELGTAARAVVEKRFDIQRVVTQYLSLYAALHSA